jgi:KipI family sensor histidine kinase inhibitor
MSARWKPLADSALLVELDGEVRAANAAARSLARRLAAMRLREVEDVVPAARTLVVSLRPGEPPSDALLAALERTDAEAPESPGRLVELAVRYGGDDGPDLDDVARLRGLEAEEVIRRHAAAEYVVAFVGFSPGFAYLLGLPPELATPRLATPRTRVPAGSVGIGGEFTGVYPSATPGGWRLVGRTDAALFDVARARPSLLEPGDRVRFVPR